MGTMFRRVRACSYLLMIMLSMEAGSLTADPITIQVVAADASGGTLTLQGAGLPQPDGNGTQIVAVGAGDAAIGYVGQTVSGDLHKSDGTWRLDGIWPANAADKAVMDEITRRLRYDNVELGRQAYRDVGDEIPNFALYDENGKLVRGNTLQGRRWVVDFVFTRCTQLDMCPAATAHMALLQKAVKAAKLNDVTLVTITFDPMYDTPGILRQYAQTYGLDLANFELLTGPQEEITALMEQFGILTRTVDGVLQHTGAAIVVSPQGRITYRKDGDFWTVDEMMQRLQPSLATATPAAAAPAKAG
jgi:protein SCO1/2